jgi:MYXO-CTERM domain-containing protein
LIGRAVIATALVVGVSGAAQAASLDLVQGYPDLKAGFLSGTLVGDDLEVSGFLQSFWPSALESVVLNPAGDFYLWANLSTGVGGLSLLVGNQLDPFGTPVVGNLFGTLLAVSSYGAGQFDLLFGVTSTTMAAFSGFSEVGVKLSLDVFDGNIDDGAADVFGVDVPEPGLLALLGLGVLAAVRRRRA